MLMGQFENRRNGFGRFGESNRFRKLRGKPFVSRVPGAKLRFTLQFTAREQTGKLVKDPGA
jgi:hypothetical protein